MPNQPKTPVRSFRLSDETMAQLRQAAAAANASVAKMLGDFAAATAKVRRYDGDVPLEGYAAAEQAMTDVAPDADGSMACPLGYGHTAHVWELTGGPSVATGIYRCAGQPFSDGWDPIDDPDAVVVAAVDAAAPFIAERAKLRTYRDVVSRLEGHRNDVDPYIITHFRTLAGDE